MDPFEIMVSSQDAARAALVAIRPGDPLVAGAPDPLESYLDLEERIVYPWLDRCGPEGSELMALALERHEAMLGEIRSCVPRTDWLLGALDGHVEISRSAEFAVLRDCLDPDGLQDLGDALEEARLSRMEADQPLPAPLDQPSPKTAPN